MNKIMARPSPPVVAKSFLNGLTKAPLVEVVVIMSFVVTAAVPVMFAVVGETLHPTAVAEPDTLQLRAMLPVNPPNGVTVMVEDPELPSVTVMAPLLVSTKPEVVTVTVALSDLAL